MISLTRNALLFLIGAILAVGGTLLFLYLEDINKPNPTRQVQAAIRDKTTMRAFAFLGGMTAVALYYTARSIYHRRVTLKRKSSGLCLSCGYDLRGGQTTCPECGLPLASQSH